MLLDKKEWLIVILSIILIIPGILYYSFNPHYVKNMISNPGLSDTIRVIPGNLDDKKLVVKLTGVSNANYALKLNLFYKAEKQAIIDSVQSETIQIPAGTFSGSFVRNFQNQFPAEKAEIIFVPEKKSATGKIEIEAGIF